MVMRESAFYVWGLLSLLLALSTSSSSALFFKLPPNARECVGVSAPAEHDVVGSYESIGGEKSVVVTLLSNGVEAYKGVEDSSNFRVVGGGTQTEYMLCFKSIISYQQTIGFSVRAQKHDTHPDDLATKDDSAKLEILVNHLNDRVQEVNEQQAYATTREEYHRTMSDSTNSRVVWWTFVKLAVFCLLSLVQIYYLRSIFEVKQLV